MAFLSLNDDSVRYICIPELKRLFAISAESSDFIEVVYDETIKQIDPGHIMYMHLPNT